MSRRVPSPQSGSPPPTFEQLVGCALPQSVVEFIIPRTDRDLEMRVHLTLKLVTDSVIPQVRQCWDLGLDFYRVIDDLMMRAAIGDQIADARAREFLNFPEVAALRMGYVQVGFAGSGVGDGVLGARLYEQLRSPALRRILRAEPDGLSVIDGFGMDRCGDVLANVVMKGLLDFTEYCADFYMFRKSSLRPARFRVWSPRDAGFTEHEATVPHDHMGRAIVLAPKIMGRSGPPLSASAYFGPNPSTPKWAEGLSWKERLAVERERNPEDVFAFVRERLSDTTRFKSRRAFRLPRPRR